MKDNRPHANTSNLIPSHGGYRQLRSFQNAELVYDATVKFCDRCLDRRSRTHDQMVQAARSGRQNIAEGSQASGHFEEDRIEACRSRSREPRRAVTRLRRFSQATRTTLVG